MLIGFAAGAVPIALIARGGSAQDGEVAAVALGWGGIGLVIGLLIDVSNKEQVTIYVHAPGQRSSGVSVSPLLSKSVAGVQMSVRF